MTRQQIVDTAYEAILRLNEVKAKYGIISDEMLEVGKKRLQAAWDMIPRIDAILSGDNSEEELSRLKAEIDKINMSPVSEKKELALPVGRFKLKLLRPLWSWAIGRR
ncbi:hypothetical protein ES703_118187 [subsurface metagenome]